MTRISICSDLLFLHAHKFEPQLTKCNSSLEREKYISRGDLRGGNYLERFPNVVRGAVNQRSQTDRVSSACIYMHTWV
jgi:hypothetical protein